MSGRSGREYEIKMKYQISPYDPRYKEKFSKIPRIFSVEIVVEDRARNIPRRIISKMIGIGTSVDWVKANNKIRHYFYWEKKSPTVKSVRLVIEPLR